MKTRRYPQINCTPLMGRVAFVHAVSMGKLLVAAVEDRTHPGLEDV